MKIKDKVLNKNELPDIRESTKKANRLAILQTAEEVFFDKGYIATNTDEIAERASVSKKTMYKHFPSKLALYVNMFDDYLQRLSDEVTETAQRNVPPDKLIFEIFDVMIDFTMKNEKFMQLYWMLDSDEFDGSIPEELINRVNKITWAMCDVVTDVIRNAQIEGTIADCDPELLAHILSAINKGIFIHTSNKRRFEIKNLKPDVLYEVLKGFLIKGLKKDFPSQ